MLYEIVRFIQPWFADLDMPDVEASELFEDPFIEQELRALVKDLAVSKSEFIRLMAAFSPSDRRENIRRAWSRTSVHSSLEG